MEEVKERVEGQKMAEQPTYEELKNYCNQLMMQRNQIVAQRDQIVQQLNQITNVINKLPWLFEVVKNQSAFNGDFVQFCIREIEAILTPPPATEESKEDTKE